ncbi:MAG TPA: RodZ domain-containing protein [Streptosporangiaceae bacterium]|nr:RodZ domain-containing protein [Streptosporangiaceae bacterium]
MSIGDALAEGRRQAGLTITQVSQRTCIRETIIRGIERGDFSSCGGDFYARGHIRSIAGAVGMNPEPLVAEYDAIMGAPHAISAADVFQPVTPVRLKERRRPNWTAAMAVVLVLLLGGFFAYHHFAHGHSAARAGQDARAHRSAGAKPTITASPVAQVRRLHIRLTATADCWVQITSAAGATIFSGMVYPGTSMNWTERHDVTMTIGNPSAVKVTVNGKSKIPPGTVNAVTLSLHAGRT